MRYRSSLDKRRFCAVWRQRGVTRLHTKPVEACGAECRGVCTGKPALEQSSSGANLSSQPFLNSAHIRATLSASHMSLSPPLRHSGPRAGIQGRGRVLPAAVPSPSMGEGQSLPRTRYANGGEDAKPGPPATCPIPLTSRNSYVQFHLVSVSVHLVSVAPPARKWHKMTQNDPLFAENLAHGLPEALMHLL